MIGNLPSPSIPLPVSVANGGTGGTTSTGTAGSAVVLAGQPTMAMPTAVSVDASYAALLIKDSSNNIAGAICGNAGHSNPQAYGELYFATSGATYLISANGQPIVLFTSDSGPINLNVGFNNNFTVNSGNITIPVPIIPQSTGPALQIQGYTGATGDLTQWYLANGTLCGNMTYNGTFNSTLIKITAADMNLGGDATGDIYYLNSSGALVRLGIGSTGQALTVVGGLPAWAGVTMSLDTGWTANADNGDKTQVIPSTATLSAMTAALNTLVAGFGTAIFATIQKVKAIEYAETQKLLANA